MPTVVENAYEHLCRISARATVPFAAGFRLDSDTVDAELEAEALRLAEASDCVVLFAGLPSIREAEGYDRSDLCLPGNQNRLIQALADLRADLGLSFRLIVVLSNGSPVEMPWADDVDAIVEAYLGGQAGGEAVARVLFGLVNPSGKLAETFPVCLADNPSYAYYPGVPEQTEYREGNLTGYRYYDSAGLPVLFPFGYGLSYTSFAYSGLVLCLSGRPAERHADEYLAERHPAEHYPAERHRAEHYPAERRVEAWYNVGMVATQKLASESFAIDDSTLEVRCVVRNSGSLAGAEVVQLYVHRAAGLVYRAEQELQGFAKLFLEPGEERELQFVLDFRAFAFWDRQSGSWQVEPGQYEVRIGASSRDIRLRQALCLHSERWQRRCERFGAQAFPGDALAAYKTAQVAGAHAVSDADFALQLGRPVPHPRPPRPFTWNSTMQQLSTRLLGRLVLRLIERSFLKSFTASQDEALKAMVARSAREMPLRSMVLMSGGKIGYRAAGILLDLMNNRPLAALLRLFGRGELPRKSSSAN